MCFQKKHGHKNDNDHCFIKGCRRPDQLDVTMLCSETPDSCPSEGEEIINVRFTAQDREINELFKPPNYIRFQYHNIEIQSAYGNDEYYLVPDQNNKLVFKSKDSGTYNVANS